MAKKHSKGAGAPKHRAKKNPFRRRHNSRNPFSGSMTNAVKVVLGGATGLLATVYIPNYLLALFGLGDTGLLGYLTAGLAAFLPPWLLKKYPTLAQGWLAGGGAGFVWRVVDDLTGHPYLSISSSVAQPGVSGFFAPAQSVLPGPNVFGPYGRKALPAAVVAAPARATGQSVGVGMGWVKYPYAA